MNFTLPYLLTFLSFASYGYLIAAFSFIHKDMTQIYQVTKTQIGFIYGFSALGSTIGTLVFVYYTSAINKKIITHYTSGNIGYSVSYIFVLIVSLSYQHPHKIFIYILNFSIGYFRSYFFPSILIMIKIHKDKMEKSQKINQNNHKFLITIWSASFDIGMILGFFGSNFIQYTLAFEWKWVLVVGIIFNLATAVLIFIKMKAYMEEDQLNQEDQLIQEDFNGLNKKIGKKQIQYKACQTTLQNFLVILNEYTPSKLFLVITPLLDIMHVGFGFVLPPYFYSYGYKGSQGNLLAVYSVFVVVGAWIFGLLDFYINKFAFNLKNKQNKKIDNIKMPLSFEQNQTSYQGQLIFPFTSSISLILFALTLLLISVDSFNEKITQEDVQQSSFFTQILYMGCLGIFFGGPTKCYFSHNAIQVMKDLEIRYKHKINPEDNQDTQLQMKNIDQINKIKEIQNNPQSQSLRRFSFFQNFFYYRKFQISSALITINCLLFQFGTIPFVIIGMILISFNKSLLFIFLLILSMILVVCDLICSCIYFKKNQEKKEK